MKKYLALIAFLFVVFSVFGSEEKVDHFSIAVGSGYLNLEDNQVARELILTALQYSDAVDITVKTASAIETFRWETVRQNEKLSIHLPAGINEQLVQVQILVKTADSSEQHELSVEPLKIKKVMVLPHSHVDIGYTDRQDRVLKLSIQNIRDAMKLAAETQGNPPEARYKWNVEVLWAVDHFLREASAEEMKQFKNAVLKGWIHLDGGYLNVNPSIMDGELLIDNFAYGCELSKKLGITIDTMMTGDIPGTSWGLANIAKETGIRYYLSAPNPTGRIGDVREEMENKPFYWKPRGGEDKALLYWQAYPYSTGFGQKGRFKSAFSKTLSEIETSDQQLDFTVITWALGDNRPIDPDLPGEVMAWNAKYHMPRLQIATTKECFNELESRYGDQLPVLSGDLSEYWIDGAGSGAFHSALNRQTSLKAAAVRTMLSLRKGRAFSSSLFRESRDNQLLFAEHTWGSWKSAWWPKAPESKTQLKIKQSYAENGAKQLKELSSEPCFNRKNLPIRFDVFNASNHTRSGIVELSTEKIRGNLKLLGDERQEIPTQRSDTGKLFFVVENMSALSSQSYQLVQAGRQNKVEQVKDQFDIDGTWFRVSLSKESGDIISLFDKENRHDWAAAPLNSYLYTLSDQTEGTRSSLVSLKWVKGAVCDQIIIYSQGVGIKSLMREVRLYHQLKRVEFVNTVDKLWVMKKESVHFDFPFNLTGGEFRYGIPYGYVNPNNDLLEGANLNWQPVNNWVDLSTEEMGMIWVSHDAPLMELGGVTANLPGQLKPNTWEKTAVNWMDEIKPRQRLLSWAMNNHWFTNFPGAQKGKVTFRYSLEPHTGGFNSTQASIVGDNIITPFIITNHVDDKIDAPFELLNPALMLSGVRSTEKGEGLLLRIYNPSASAQPLNLTLTDSHYETLFRSNLAGEALEKNSSADLIKPGEVVSILIQ